MKPGFRTYHEVSGADRSDLPGQLAAQVERIAVRLQSVSRVLGVMSGKGGVGKSLVAAGMAGALGLRGERVGLLDADLASPTVLRMCGIAPRPMEVMEGGVRPLRSASGLAVMSLDAVLADGAPLEWSGPSDAAFAWRGAQERSALRELLGDVEWGELDWLVVDLPPGTDRLLDLADLTGGKLSVLTVTIPSEASRASVARALSSAADRRIHVLGIVENMSGYLCTACGEPGPLLPGNAAETLAAAFGIQLLGHIPFDPEVAARAEIGEVERGIESTAAGRAIAAVADRLLSTGEDA